MNQILGTILEKEHSLHKNIPHEKKKSYARKGLEEVEEEEEEKEVEEGEDKRGAEEEEEKEREEGEEKGGVVS